MAAIHDILRYVSTISAIPIDDLTGKNRGRMYIRARMVFAHFARAEGYNYPKIGAVLGGRDRSTAINLVEKAGVWRGRDPLFDRLMDRMAEAMRDGRVIVPTVKLHLRATSELAEEFAPIPFDTFTRRGHHEIVEGSRNLLAAMAATSSREVAA